jgi:hypothetical protein
MSQPPPQNDATLNEAFVIATSIIVLLILLAVIRYCCNSVIDACLNGCECHHRIWRKLCPWWHRRTGPMDATVTTTTRDVEEAAEDLPMTAERRKALVKELLYHRILLDADMKSCNTTKDVEGNTNGATANGDDAMITTCSICLRELLQGDTAFTPPCGHLFHLDCILSWIANGEHESGKDCPNCRTEFMTSAQLIKLRP